jgi:hypothetical protein
LQKSSLATIALVEGGEGRVILASSISISLWAVPRAVPAAPGLSVASSQELCRIIVK